MPAACPNCGSPSSDRWCSRCGQWNLQGPGAAREQLLVQWGRIRHTLVALLLRPGQLTVEFRDGQRVRAIAPWRLALNAISIFFVLAVVTGFNALGMTPEDLRPHVTKDVEQLVERLQLPRPLVVERIERRFNTAYTVLMGFSVLGYALLSAATHRRARQGWMVHAVLAMHLMAFIFIGALISFGLVHLVARALALGPPAEQLLRHSASLVFLVIFTGHLALAFRRVYADGPVAAGIKGVFVAVAGSFVDSALFQMALGIAVSSL